MDLYLLRGVPGAGKTTLAKHLSNFVHAADDYMINALGEYCFDPERLYYCHKACERAVTEDMKLQRTPLVVHNTLIRRRDLRPYLELAAKYGYRVHILCVEHHHQGQSVHDVPTETLEKMGRRYQTADKYIKVREQNGSAKRIPSSSRQQEAPRKLPEQEPPGSEPPKP